MYETGDGRVRRDEVGASGGYGVPQGGVPKVPRGCKRVPRLGYSGGVSMTFTEEKEISGSKRRNVVVGGE